MKNKYGMGEGNDSMGFEIPDRCSVCGCLKAQAELTEGEDGGFYCEDCWDEDADPLEGISYDRRNEQVRYSDGRVISPVVCETEDSFTSWCETSDDPAQYDGQIWVKVKNQEGHSEHKILCEA